jgi:hypothetical protein
MNWFKKAGQVNLVANFVASQKTLMTCRSSVPYRSLFGVVSGIR